MKRAIPRLAVFFLCILTHSTVFGQSGGRVVINEYMPWTSNGCGTTSEFVELLNFGPGAVDISCYIITTGQYSITIPQRTVLQPGEFYVLAGQDFLPGDCGNVDSVATGVHADLNWNTCGCTNVPIPTSGDGMMVDGGSSNTPLVLFDPSLNIVDAVVRSLPTEPTNHLLTSGVTGCSPHGFDIGAMPVLYEELGMSAGRGNSFARITDGDCGWVKDPKQSAGASNNRSGDMTDIAYSFSLINAMSCDSTGGRINIYVEHADYTTVFPMSYTIANDVNNDGLFDEHDKYETFYDSTPPSVDIVGLPVGHYRVTVSSVKGCYLRTFEFSIFTCSEVLPVSFEYVRMVRRGSGSYDLAWRLNNVQSVKSMEVQKSRNGQVFKTEKVIFPAFSDQGTKNFQSEIDDSDGDYQYRIGIEQKNGAVLYSTTTRVGQPSAALKLWPNPVGTKLFVQSKSGVKMQSFQVFDAFGRKVSEGNFTGQEREQVYTVYFNELMPGVYHIKILPASNEKPDWFRFIKQ